MIMNAKKVTGMAALGLACTLVGAATVVHKDAVAHGRRVATRLRLPEVYCQQFAVRRSNRKGRVRGGV